MQILNQINRCSPLSESRLQRRMRQFIYICAFVGLQTMCFAATISVTTAGATGNGTTDDTAAIQSALNSLAAGDTLVFPAGTYRITSRITVPSNRTLQGQSGATLKGSIGGQLLQGMWNNARSITIDGLTFDGGGILFNGSSSAYPADSIKITNNRFQNIIVGGDYNADGIHAWSGMTNSQISFNTFTNIYDASRVAGWSEVCGAIWLFDPSSTVITDNTFNKTCQAMHVTAKQNGHDLSVLRNTMTGTARYNIEIQGPYSINNVLVNNNYIAQMQPGINGQAGISVAVGGTGHQIFYNTLLGPNENNSTNQSDAIESMGSGFVIQGNVAGHWGEAQLIGYSDATWSTKSNTWCDMNYSAATAVIQLETGGQYPAVNTGNVFTSSCSGVVFPTPTTVVATPPAAPPVVTLTTPSSGAVVTGTIQVSATATSTLAVASVSFILDGGQTIGKDTAAPFSITWDTSLVADGAHTLKAVAVDANGNTGTSAIINVTTQNAVSTLPAPIPPQGLQLWLKGDAGVTLANGKVASWADQSGKGIRATQATASLQPAFAQTGQGNVIRFDGSGTNLSFPLAINGWTGMTIVLVAANTVDVTGGSSPHAAIFWDETAWWGTTYLSPYQSNVSFRFGTTQTNNWPDYKRPASVGSSLNLTETMHSGSTDSLYVNGILAYSEGGKLSAIQGNVNVGTLGLGYGNTPFAGDIAEVLVYNRALSDAERQSLDAYLMSKYALSTSAQTNPPVVSLTAPSPNSFVTGKITVSGAVTSTAPLSSVSFILDGNQTIGQDFASPFSITWDTSLVADGAHTLKAVAVDANGSIGTSAIINVTTQNAVAAPPAIPPQGLQLWLKGDAGISAAKGRVVSWADQSGHGIQATQPTVNAQPSVAKSGSLSVVRFDGSRTNLSFPLAINGWTGMTILMVAANSINITGGSSPNAAIFWDETAWWGTTYLSPYQTNVSYRFGTTQTYNWPDYKRPASVGTALNLTETVHSGTTDYLYVNGTLAYSEGGKYQALQGNVNVGALGKGYGNTFFGGDIAEVLVYNRALSDAERQGIETYLMNKYSLR